MVIKLLIRMVACLFEVYLWYVRFNMRTAYNITHS